MNFFLQSGDNFFPAPSQDALLKGLPNGYYTVEQDPMTQALFFKRAKALPHSTKIYGDLPSKATRIIRTFQDRTVNTGVLLTGEKGSGKSLLARLVSEEAINTGMPVVMIRQDFDGAVLAPLLDNLNDPAVIFIDEFEKLYKKTELQESLLTLLDGSSSSKHLFLLTVNSRATLNSFLTNRPGRIFYNLLFEGLEEDFIREYCEDKLEDQEKIPGVLQVSRVFGAFNFDMLKALVEEMNRYDETATNAAQWLNMAPEDDGEVYEVLIEFKGETYSSYYPEYHGSPMLLTNYRTYVKGFGEDEDTQALPVFERDHMKHFDAVKGVYLFQRDDWQITFSRKNNRGVHWTEWANAF